VLFFFRKTIHCVTSAAHDRPLRAVAAKKTEPKKITLGGGSLGSCVDEERSQLRELM